jgi:hypothetical protein
MGRENYKPTLLAKLEAENKMTDEQKLDSMVRGQEYEREKKDKEVLEEISKNLVEVIAKIEDLEKKVRYVSHPTIYLKNVDNEVRDVSYPDQYFCKSSERMKMAKLWCDERIKLLPTGEIDPNEESNLKYAKYVVQDDEKKGRKSLRT